MAARLPLFRCGGFAQLYLLLPLGGLSLAFEVVRFS